MALKSTIYKVNVELANMDQHYYDSLQLTIARHPSETEQRLIIRIICYILNAHPDLKFGKGISNEEEATIWQINYSNEIDLWIELGQLDEKRLKKACNKAKKVKLYCYGTSTDIWWSQIKSKVNKLDYLSVEKFDHSITDSLIKLISKTMEFQCSIQDGQLWLSSENETLLIETEKLK